MNTNTIDNNNTNEDKIALYISSAVFAGLKHANEVARDWSHEFGEYYSPIASGYVSALRGLELYFMSNEFDPRITASEAAITRKHIEAINAVKAYGGRKQS